MVAVVKILDLEESNNLKTKLQNEMLLTMVEDEENLQGFKLALTKISKAT